MPGRAGEGAARQRAVLASQVPSKRPLRVASPAATAGLSASSAAIAGFISAGELLSDALDWSSSVTWQGILRTGGDKAFCQQLCSDFVCHLAFCSAARWHQRRLLKLGLWRFGRTSPLQQPSWEGQQPLCAWGSAGIAVQCSWLLAQMKTHHGMHCMYVNRQGLDWDHEQ